MADKTTIHIKVPLQFIELSPTVSENQFNANGMIRPDFSVISRQIKKAVDEKGSDISIAIWKKLNKVASKYKSRRK